MPPVEVYTTPYCPYCVSAKELLRNKGVTFVETCVDLEPALRAEMMQRTRRRTVPQIYIGEIHVGGYDDLYELDEAGKLDPLLQG